MLLHKCTGSDLRHTNFAGSCGGDEVSPPGGRRRRLAAMAVSGQLPLTNAHMKVLPLVPQYYCKGANQLWWILLVLVVTNRLLCAMNRRCASRPHFSPFLQPGRPQHNTQSARTLTSECCCTHSICTGIAARCLQRRQAEAHLVQRRVAHDAPGGPRRCGCPSSRMLARMSPPPSWNLHTSSISTDQCARSSETLVCTCLAAPATTQHPTPPPLLPAAKATMRAASLLLLAFATLGHAICDVGVSLWPSTAKTLAEASASDADCRFATLHAGPRHANGACRVRPGGAQNPSGHIMWLPSRGGGGRVPTALHP